MTSLTFTVKVPNAPQKTFAKWYLTVEETSETFLIGQTVGYTDADGDHRGLYQTRVINDIPQLHYDRHRSEALLGLWAHFIWPSVTAESGNGHHLIVNTYDRARFTFGFYQLAAHTPKQNLILLFRKLLELPSAHTYFPDLFLKNNRVHRTEGPKTYSLEAVTTVHRPNGKVERQLVAFMTYLNPDTYNANEREALNAGKLMHWLMSDDAALSASVSVAFEIMHAKIKKAATSYKLAGRDPRLAIWVSDILHQGRGNASKIKAALAKPSVSAQLEALSEIDIYTNKYPAGQFAPRRRSVMKSIETLHTEGVFSGIDLGGPGLEI